MTIRWPKWLFAAFGLVVGTGGPAVAEECRTVAGLAQEAVGQFPEEWKPRKDKAREIYRVLREGGLRFVRATADGTGLQIARRFVWNLETHPVLAWRWRPRVFPTGADERRAARNDSALGVYVVFPNGATSVRTVKYVWSLTAPVGTIASASMGLTRMMVLRSGRPAESGWVEETANVAGDYARLFGTAPKPPRGIALLTDADDTESRAVGDYAAFAVCPGEGLPPMEPGTPAPGSSRPSR